MKGLNLCFCIGKPDYREDNDFGKPRNRRRSPWTAPPSDRKPHQQPRNQRGRGHAALGAGHHVAVNPHGAADAGGGGISGAMFVGAVYISNGDGGGGGG
ncbi:DYW_deaminase domain-containing protein [Psidium guajava]|nr:DYW_deaminase domain-containing protein [Psidium guajava]